MPKTLDSTKHFQLSQTLRAEIKKMKPGDVLPSVIEMKARYGVSQATVDRATERLRREGLILRLPGQQRLLVAEHADPAENRIALIRPDYPSPTFDELARTVIDAGRARDWAFELVSYRRLDALSLKRAVGENDAAVLLPTSESFPKALLAALERPRWPIVVIQDPPLGVGVSSVRIDDQDVSRLAVEHLAGLGHRRILAFMSEPTTPSGTGRMLGWQAAMTAMGEANLEELLVDCNLKPFENSMTGSYEYFCRWLDRPHVPFTAVYCAAWTGALAVLRALRERGIKVPGQVSVVGHGGEGHIAPFMNPPLTSVDSDISGYGKLVVEVLAEALSGKKKRTPVHRVVPSMLVVRETTGAVGNL